MTSEQKRAMLLNQAKENAQYIANASGVRHHVFCVPGPLYYVISDQYIGLVLEEMNNMPILSLEPEEDIEPQDPTDIGLWSDEPGFPLGEEDETVSVFALSVRLSALISDEAQSARINPVVDEDGPDPLRLVRVNKSIHDENGDVTYLQVGTQNFKLSMEEIK